MHKVVTTDKVHAIFLLIELDSFIEMCSVTNEEKTKRKGMQQSDVWCGGDDDDDCIEVSTLFYFKRIFIYSIEVS